MFGEKSQRCPGALKRQPPSPRASGGASRSRLWPCPPGRRILLRRALFFTGQYYGSIGQEHRDCATDATARLAYLGQRGTERSSGHRCDGSAM